MTEETSTSAIILDMDGDDYSTEFSELMKSLNTDKFLVIQKRSTNTMTAYPVRDEDIYHLRLLVDVSKMDFKPGSTCMQMDRKIGPDDHIYRTMLEKIGNDYYYECYFYGSEVHVPIDTLRDELLSVDGIDDAIIERVR